VDESGQASVTWSWTNIVNKAIISDVRAAMQTARASKRGFVSCV
jgi:hypothetical protein